MNSLAYGPVPYGPDCPSLDLAGGGGNNDNRDFNSVLLLFIVIIVIFVAAIGCENHYVPPASPELDRLISDIQSDKPLSFDAESKCAELEARIANLELKCIDGKPEPPKAEKPPEKPFNPQIPKKKLTIRERVKCIVYSTESCVPCQELKLAIEKDLCGKLGWKCGESDDCDFIFKDSNSWPSYPVIEFRVDDSPKKRIFGRMPTADMSNELKRLMDTLDREA